MGEAGLTTEDISGHHVIVAELDHIRFIAGVKVKPHPIHDAWKKRLGKYKLLNPSEPEIFLIKDFDLKLEDGYLLETMTFSENAGTQILQTVNAQEAICGGFETTSIASEPWLVAIVFGLLEPRSPSYTSSTS